MINRTLIRQKVLAITYACYQDASKNSKAAERELLTSLDQGYDLYRYLLLLLVDLRRYAEIQAEARRTRNRRLALPDEEHAPDKALAENRLLLTLENSTGLRNFIEEEKKPDIWQEEGATMKRLYKEITAWGDMMLHASQADFSFESDKSIVRKIYRKFIVGSEAVDVALEEVSIYWNDDRYVIDTFVDKTLKQTHQGEETALLPQYESDNDRTFATTLFHEARNRSEEIKKLIADNCRGWDFSRLALMDTVIVHLCLAEILALPDIPLRVSLNEYIELAKAYSTPRSASYVNGLLNHIVGLLREQHQILKQ